MIGKTRRSLFAGALPLSIVWLALLLRLVYIANTPQFLNVDARGYHQLALNLSGQGIFSIATEPPFYPDHIRAPLYPIFIAIIYFFIGPFPVAVAMAQALLDSLTVAVAFRLGKEIGGRRIGIATAFLYAFNPSSWRFCNELLTEILFGLLLTASLWMLVRYILHHQQRDMLLFGLLTGLTTLCKSNIQFIPVLLVMVLLYKLWTRQRTWWQGTAIAAVIITLTLLPWITRNRIIFGQWFYTTTFEYNLSLISSVSTLAHARGEVVAPWTPRWWAIYEEIYLQAKSRSKGVGCDASRFLCQRDIPLADLTANATEIIQKYPLDFAASHVKGWLRSFIPQEHRFWYERLSGQPWSVLPYETDVFGSALAAAKQGRIWTALDLIIQKRLLVLPPLALILWTSWGIGYLMAAILFGLGVLKVRPRILALIFIFAVFYVTFLPGPISEIRFRLPVIPVILLLVVIGLFSLAKRRDRNRRQQCCPNF